MPGQLFRRNRLRQKNMRSNNLKKWLLTGFTFAACLLALGFIQSGWEGHQAKKKLFHVKTLIDNDRNADREIAKLEESLPALAKDPFSLNKFGKILSALGRKNDAIRIYEKSGEAACSPDTLIILSSLYLETKQYDKAIDSASQASNILPWKLRPRFTQASAYHKKGENKKAFQFCLDTILTREKRRSQAGLELKQEARKLLPLCIPEEIRVKPNLDPIISAIKDPDARLKLKTALLIAGKNRSEMEKALLEIPGERLDALIFLISNMPESDLQSLDSSYLLSNIDCAYEVRNIWPFIPDIPEDIFLNYLLPYAQLGEKRDSWREDFITRWMPTVNECKSVGEVVMSLQIWLPHKLGLIFDNENRSRPDWSIGELIKHKTGNCIGFSIILADACRAVGIPARIATIPNWKDVPGGHTWVEIWDQGEWRHVSAFDQSPINRTWFEERTAETDTTKFSHRLYGASFERTGVQIRRYGPDVWWTDVTANYVKNPDIGTPVQN